MTMKDERAEQGGDQSRTPAGDGAGASASGASSTSLDRAAKDPAALAVEKRHMGELQREMEKAIESPELVPLLGAFQDFIDMERQRNARRSMALSILFCAVLCLFLAGPVYMGRTFLKRAEAAFASERQSFDQFSGTVQTGMASLTKATEELRQTLEAQKHLLLSLQASTSTVSVVQGAGPGVTNAVAATMSPPAQKPAAVKPAGEAVPSAIASAPKTRPEALTADLAPAEPMLPEAGAAGAARTNVAAAAVAAPVATGTVENIAALQDQLMKIITEVEATVKTIDREHEPLGGAATNKRPLRSSM